MYHQTLAAVAAHAGVGMDTAWSDLPVEAKQLFLYGSGRKKIDFVYQTGAQNRTVRRTFEGVIPNLQRRYHESSSDDVREELGKDSRSSDCPACQGARLNLTARHVLVGDLSLPTVCSLPLHEAKAWISNLKLSAQDQAIAEKVVEEIAARLGFMIEVGLNYLSLGRTAGTLSGGESQRIRLATQIGSALVGVLDILDEPSIGLH